MKRNNLKKARFTSDEIRWMFKKITAKRGKWYRGTMTMNIKHLFRHECLILCYLWQYGIIPSEGLLRDVEKTADLMRIFEAILDERRIKWKCLECKSRYNLEHDKYRYEFSGFRLLPAGIRLALEFPLNKQ